MINRKWISKTLSIKYYILIRNFPLKFPYKIQ
uniref:Uncharacterized protein n=1 Tax=Anguilla anguilla TaxID=7936 RepID=A0A0E9W1S5_ANGAN